MTDIKIGTKVKDRYTLKEFKGSGSFGEVWLAHDEVLDSDIAIKIYISLDPRGVEEFKSEYITTQGISHPNLLTTTYYDVWEQRPFLVMKYCEKGSSSSLVGKMDEYALWKFIHDVAAGLKYLHSMADPIIHQDVKPDNILVDDFGHFLITDFGISKKIRSTMRKLSKRAVGAGATAYMGPERFENDPTPVKASDIWSLGVSIFELATGELPFSGLGGGMQRNGAEMPSLDKTWSKELNMVMQSCLAKETWDRPTAEQLEDFSEAIIKGQAAKPTWRIIDSNSIGAGNDCNISTYEDENDEGSIFSLHKRKIIFLLCGIIATIILVVFFWHSNEKSVIRSDGKIEMVDTMNVDTMKLENKPKQEADPKSSAQEVTVKKKVLDDREKDECEISNNASLLKKALANGNYKQIQRLANEGYAPAYGPLAKYYLQNHDYATAESYAKKASMAGYKEGSSILRTLKNLGYYD